MICVDSNGQAIEISVADQMWLDDAYFKGKQIHLEADAPRVALAYRVSTKGQVDHDDIPMQKIDCRIYANHSVHLAVHLAKWLVHFRKTNDTLL